MQARTMTFQTLGRDGELFGELFRARKRTFIDEMGWALPTALGMEFDQYDTPFSSWVVVNRGPAVLGGVRLTPTTAKVMGSSYMIKDAQNGLLPGMPSDLLEGEAPVSDDIWEASRVFVSADNETGPDRLRVREMLLKQMLQAAHNGGARYLICILPSWWPRLRRSGLELRAAGPVVDIDGKHQVVKIDVLNSPLRLEADVLQAISQVEVVAQFPLAS
jgi:N-acyl-L-homoserine lactone synthetase